MPNYEDALLMQCAKAGGIDFIVARNKKDFQGCPVESLSLDEWVERFCPDRMLLEAENRMRSAGEADLAKVEEDC